MKLSQFTVVVNDYPTTDHHLLYHTLSQELLKVDKAGWNMLQNLSKITPTDAQALAALKALQAKGFIVEESINEGERYLQYLNQGASQPGGELSVTLLTNLQPLSARLQLLLPERNAYRRAVGGRSVRRMSRIYQSALPEVGR